MSTFREIPLSSGSHSWLHIGIPWETCKNPHITSQNSDILGVGPKHWYINFKFLKKFLFFFLSLKIMDVDLFTESAGPGLVPPARPLVPQKISMCHQGWELFLRMS